MDQATALWLIGGAVGLLLALLILVRIARRLDVRPSAATPVAPTPSTGEPRTRAEAFRSLISAARTNRLERFNNMSAGRRIFAILGGSVAVIAGVFGFVMSQISERENMNPVESEITAGALHGTMLSPSNHAPIVLVVPGSGPTDRDGNSRLGLNTDSYKLLAEGLAHEGIASVRVDKRGMYGSAGAGDGNAVSVDIYAQDYRAWIDAIRAQHKTKCVWLLGHSEGALMVSAAAEGRKDVCGLILVSGMGRKMSDVIRQQLKDNPANAPLLDQALPAIDKLEAGEHVDTTGMNPALLQLFAPQVQDYLISMFKVDPVDVLRRANKKTLVIQGTTDLQVTEADARLLVKAPKSHLRLIAGMNHVLKEAPADRAANLATYNDPTLPLAPNLIRRIRNFIKDDE